MVRAFINSLHSYIASCLSPARCVYCQCLMSQDAAVLCASCYRTIPRVPPTVLTITPSLTVPVLAATAYTFPLSALIHAKDHADIGASKQLGHLIWQLTPLRSMSIDIVVPVPIHWTRYAYRGYNQSHELALVLQGYNGKPVLDLVIAAQKSTRQSGLSLAQRQQNVRHVFMVNERYTSYTNKHIVIVDDVMITGTTLRAVAQALAPLRPASITAVVAARTLS